MRALVTGAGGFLGGAIVDQLLARGDEVRAYQRGDYPELAAKGVQCFRGDLGDERLLPLLTEAMQGVDCVFHVAAKAGVWGPESEYHWANVVATEHVVAACRAAHVTRLVFTSSPSVVFDGRDECHIDERAPYLSEYLAHYPRTKAIAEKFALAANCGRLAVTALRPHLIWGPGDQHLVPRIIERARSGRLRLVSRDDNLVDATYIDNAAHAHLLAADRLHHEAPCAGRAYFIGNNEPVPLAELVNRILAAAGLPPCTKRISPNMAFVLGSVCEMLYTLLRIQREPPLTRFVARQLSTAHYFDLSAARRDLGYEPLLTLSDGLARLRAHLSPAGGSACVANRPTQTASSPS